MMFVKKKVAATFSEEIKKLHDTSIYMNNRMFFENSNIGFSKDGIASAEYGDLVTLVFRDIETDILSDDSDIVGKGMLVGYGYEIENILLPEETTQSIKKYVDLKDLRVSEVVRYYIGKEYYSSMGSDSYLCAKLYKLKK